MANNEPRLEGQAGEQTARPLPDSGISRSIDDYLVKATAKQGLLRCLAVRTTGLAEESRLIHDLSPSAAVGMGRLLTAVLLAAADLKNPEDSLSAIIRGSGELASLTAIADAFGGVRGTVGNPHAETYYRQPGKIDLGRSIGAGTLTVVTERGLKEPYVGSVELISGEIAEDFAAYYYYSQQIPTVLFLGVKLNREGVTQAGGLLVQAMPGADDDLLDWLEQRAAGFPELTEFMEQGFDPHQLIDLLIGDPDLEYLEAVPVRYSCPCSRERMERNLLTLGREDYAQLLDDPSGIETVCHYCGEKYHFSQQELRHLSEQGSESGV